MKKQQPEKQPAAKKRGRPANSYSRKPHALSIPADPEKPTPDPPARRRSSEPIRTEIHNSEKRENAIVSARKDAVARWLVKGKVLREIRDLISEEGIVNPSTGKKWCLDTISLDVAEIRMEWKQSLARTGEEHKSRILAELMAVAAAAWEKEEFKPILQSLKQQTELLGLDAPIEIKETGAVRVVHLPPSPGDQQAWVEQYGRNMSGEGNG